MVNISRATSIGKQPLILTLWMDAFAQNYFDRLRQQFYPPDLNYLKAHLTLFHALTDTSDVVDELATMVKTQSVFRIEAEAVVSLGKGTAIKVASTTLDSLHRKLQSHWFEILTVQDKQKLWPHITIQNKVTLEEARALKTRLMATFERFQFCAVGLKLWRYRGGPWEPVTEFQFFDYQL